MRTMHLFAGAGGGLLADLILGHQPVVAVDWEPYACQILRERAADGWFPGLHVYEGDVRLFDPSEYAGRVDCIHAGFPCQDISVAGSQAGVGENTRSGLYREVLRIADAVRPECIFLENVAAIVSVGDGHGLRTVAGDLAERGLDAVWCCLSAAEVGAKHRRDRWWCLGYPKHDGPTATKVGEVFKERNGSDPKRAQQASQSTRSSEQHEDVGNAKSQSSDGSRVDKKNGAAQTSKSGSAGGDRDVPNPTFKRIQGSEPAWKQEPYAHAKEALFMRSGTGRGGSFWQAESEVGRVVDGMANRAHMLKALGNGQVPLQAATAFSILWKMKEAAA